MQRIYKYLFLLLSFSSNAQNLVPNPSFEDTISCPHFANQIDMAIGWNASRNSPDYFNECDWLTGNQSVPNNIIGFQYAHTGYAYAGLITYSRSGPNYREHFSCGLLSPLVIGKKYHISFYASLANNYSNLSSNKLGVLFSTLAFNTTFPSPLLNNCQFYSDSIIGDTLNWTLIEGTFVADSNYTYMTVGNFFDDSNTDTIYNPPASHCYYFIDDLLLKEDTTTQITNFFDEIKSYIVHNPVNDILNLKISHPQYLRAEIININGQTVSKIEGNYSTELLINIKNLSSGVYYLRLESNKNQNYFKLLKL